MLKTFPLDKVNVTKHASFFLSRAPTHHSFTFNWLFLYEWKYKVCLSKSMCGVFHVRFRFVFIKIYVFVQQSMNSLTLNVIIPFSIKIIEKPHKVLLPELSLLSYNKKF